MGSPLAESIIKQISWKDLFDKLKKKLGQWTYQALNLPSRIILVKSVLQAMPLYLFSVLATPKSVLKQIRNIQRTFLWGGTKGHKKWALVDWNTLCKPKFAGGLGLWDSVNINRVTREKIWWKWISHSKEPWEKLWNHKYAP